MNGKVIYLLVLFCGVSNLLIAMDKKIQGNSGSGELNAVRSQKFASLSTTQKPLLGTPASPELLLWQTFVLQQMHSEEEIERNVPKVVCTIVSLQQLQAADHEDIPFIAQMRGRYIGHRCSLVDSDQLRLCAFRNVVDSISIRNVLGDKDYYKKKYHCIACGSGWIILGAIVVAGLIAYYSCIKCH